MAVIIPCAGKSSRFPGTRPKYLLTMHDGLTMFEKAAADYPVNEPVHFIILKEHDELYGAFNAIVKAYGEPPNSKRNYFIHVLDKITSGPAETVYKIAKTLPDQPIIIRDCDSFFNVPLLKTNHVCVADLRENLYVTSVASKSFAVVNDQNIITNIVEKSVSSNFICVGGYSFESSKQFCDTYEKLKSHSGEIFISHIIKQMIETVPFKAEKVINYVDCGTYSEFVKYNQSKSTIFCDIDGTVFYNQSKLFHNSYDTPPRPIPNAVKYLLEKQKNGCKIIFTTSRSEEYAEITIDALRTVGFKDISVLFNLPHAPRVLINDNSTTNPYPTATAINVPRDDNDFWSKLA